MKYFFILLVFLYSHSASAAEIYGRVTDKNDQPLPFANIYIKGTSIGCATNIDGYYTFHLDPGTYAVIYQFLGYQKQEKEIALRDERLQINVQLQDEVHLLESVIISSDTEDPAYAIIREAIKKRAQHLRENDLYSCDVYIKGLQKLTKGPDKLLGVELDDVLDIDSNNTGIFYLSESSSKFYFQYPDKTKEIMVASKVSGNNTQFSYNDAKAMQLNFYENNMDFLGLAQRGIISPIADNALLFYTYELLGSFNENNVLIYKIRVEPKRKTDPVLRGEIYITGNDYHIYSTQLFLTRQNGVDFIDTFRVKQEFVGLPDNRWALLSNQFSFSYTFLGISGGGYANAFYKNYVFDDPEDKHIFDGEISHITDDANKKDSVFWDASRPVQLTDEEKKDYHLKDSIYILKNTDAYKDSMDHIANRLRLLDLVTGYSYRNSKAGVYISTAPLIDIIQFNTVEGYVLEPALSFRKVLPQERVLIIEPAMQYSFALQRALPYAAIQFDYDAKHAAWLRAEGGRVITQINPEGIADPINSLYTLLLEENYLKLYEKNYISIAHSTETWNGVYFTTSLEYAHRTSLLNDTSSVPWINFKEKEFTPNTVYFPEEIFTGKFYDLFLLSITCKYAIAQKYMTVPGKKYVVDAKYPTLYGTYKKAIPGIYNSAVQYDYLELKAEDNISLKLAGNIAYSITTGKYFTMKNMSVTDIKHFSGNETLISKLNEDSFFSLPYYSFSTTDPFYELHAAYHTEGFLFNKLPLFKQLKLQPVFSANALLLHGESNNYYELAGGVEHLFKFLRIDIVASKTENIKAVDYALKFGLGF